MHNPKPGETTAAETLGIALTPTLACAAGKAQHCSLESLTPEDGRRLAAEIQKLVNDTNCDHVSVLALSERDTTLHALFASPCFDVNATAYRCAAPENGTLFLVVHRRLDSYATEPIRFTVSIDTTPPDTLKVENGRTRRDALQVDLRPVVLGPVSNVFHPSEWHTRVQVRREPGPRAESGAITITARATVGNGKPARQVAQLLVGIPDRSAPEPARSKDQLDMLIMTLSDSIAHVLSIAGNDRLSPSVDQFALAGITFSHDLESVKPRLREAGPLLSSLFPPGKMVELDTLNRAIDELITERARLIANAPTASTTVDKSRAEARAASIEREIQQYRQRVRLILGASNNGNSGSHQAV